ncbi:MAG: Transcription antitermination protein NusB [Chlamydiae bacterium]|nr:Transcription antitermination protein NusB [Chlamydiota bacterium]
MTFPQNKFRELVFQILYSHHFMEDAQDQDPAFYMKQLKTTKKNVLDAFSEVEKILTMKNELDEEISRASTSYDISRIQSVELNILRLCLYEMKKEDALKTEILISEGIRLSKKFSTTESISFINGVLDHLCKNNSELVYNP